MDKEVRAGCVVCGPSDDVAGHQDSAAYGEEGLRAGGYRVRGRGYDASVRRDELTEVAVLPLSSKSFGYKALCFGKDKNCAYLCRR